MVKVNTGESCSGTVISTNSERSIILTAAHCGANGATATVTANAGGTPIHVTGILIHGPDAGTENDRFPGASNVAGAHDIATIRTAPIPASAASVSPVYLGHRTRNQLSYHSGGGTPNDVTSVATVIGYGDHCLRFRSFCPADAPDGERFQVDGWAYNWIDDCRGDLPLCTDAPVIAMASNRSQSGAEKGDSGGPLFRTIFTGSQYVEHVVGVTSCGIEVNPLGFEGTIFAPVSTNLGNLRWLSDQLSREPDFYEENVALNGIDSVNVHDRATLTDTSEHPMSNSVRALWSMATSTPLSISFEKERTLPVPCKPITANIRGCHSGKET